MGDKSYPFLHKIGTEYNCFRRIPLIHINIEVLRRTLSDSNKAKELLLKFKSTLPCELKILDQGIHQQEWDAVQARLHRLRSGSLYLGIESIGFPAKMLEELINPLTSQDRITAAWADLYEACQDYLSLTDAELLARLNDLSPDPWRLV